LGTEIDLIDKQIGSTIKMFGRNGQLDNTMVNSPLIINAGTMAMDGKGLPVSKG